MPAPKGNTFAKGNRGGGRKSAYDELRDAEWLADVWASDHRYDELRSKIEVTKVYSPRDMMLWKALNGSDAILKTMADKVLATKQEVNVNQELELVDPQAAEEIARVLGDYYKSKEG